MVKESRKRDQYTVVLEALRSDFKIFGEALIGVNDNVKKIEKRFEKVGTDLELIKKALVL